MKFKFSKRCGCGKILKLKWYHKLLLSLKGECWLKCDNCLKKYKIKRICHDVVDNTCKDNEYYNKVLMAKREKMYWWW